MSLRGAAWLSLAVLAIAPLVKAQDQARRLTAGPDRRVELDFQHFYTQRDLEVALGALAGAYPEFLRLETMGKSRGGHQLWVMTVARLEGQDPSERPALFLAGGLGAEDLHGTEMALFTILELVQNHERDPAVEALLANSVCYIAPCLNPDLRERVFGGADGAASGAGEAVDGAQVRLDENFPTAWRPGPTSGSYPLSEPETLRMAEYLLGHANVGVVQTYTGSMLSLAIESAFRASEASDLAAYRDVLGSIPNPDRQTVQGLFDMPERPGSLLEFAYGQHGAFAFRTVVAGSGTSAVGPSVPEVGELAPLGRKAFQTTLRLAQTLPRLSLTEPSAQRMSDDLWQLDVGVQNEGLLPTASALGASRFACGAPGLSVTGGKVLAWAVSERDGSHVPAHGNEARLDLGEVSGGERLSVRLIVRAAAGATVELRATSPRAGTDSAQLTLE